MFLQSFILEQAERKLASYRLSAKVIKKEHTEEYEKYLPKIQDRYVAATYWHGTGRYHYQYEGESRYESVHSDGILDVLDSIIKHNGLIPHQDPWIDSGGKTVSLGTVRMHSKLFAQIHQNEKNTLLFELGSARYWIQLYFVLALSWLFSSMESARQFGKILCRRALYKDMRTWASAIRTPNAAKALGLGDIIAGNMLSSDIEGNYALLFGVAKESLEVMNTIPLVHVVEVRSLQPITLKDFTHVEVPLSNVEETKAFLANRNISMEVLPMEFVDVYLSTRSVQELAYS